MREELRTLQRELDQTTIFVTHDQTEAFTMSDRVAVLSNGRIEQIGAPRHIYAAPDYAFRRDFIGESNTLEGVIDSEEEGLGNFDSPVVRACTRGFRKSLAMGRRCRLGHCAAGEPPHRPIQRRRRSQRRPRCGMLAGTVKRISYPARIACAVEVRGLPPLLASMKATRAGLASLSRGEVRIEIDADDVVCHSPVRRGRARCRARRHGYGLIGPYIAVLVGVSVAP